MKHKAHAEKAKGAPGDVGRAQKVARRDQGHGVVAAQALAVDDDEVLSDDDVVAAQPPRTNIY